MLEWRAMETRYIRYLDAVARHGSISAAARALDMNQPHLTKVLHRIEREFGATFLDRGPRGVTMTPLGARFLARARLIDREMADISAELEDMRSGRSGHVCIGAGQTWLSSMLPSAIAECTARLPGLTLTVETGPRVELLAALRAGEVDLYLGTVADDSGPGITATPIATVPYKLTAREGHPILDRGDAIDCPDLVAYEWILPPGNDPTILHLRRVFRERGARMPHTVVEAVSFNFVMHTLRHSDLLGVLPDVAMRGFTEGLVSLDLPWLTAARVVGVHRLTDRQLIPAAHTFVEILREVAARTAPGG